MLSRIITAATFFASGMNLAASVMQHNALAGMVAGWAFVVGVWALSRC